jgi:hypothetical protein
MATVTTFALPAIIAVDIREYALYMYLFTGVGAAALVTGGVLYYLGDRARKLEPSSAALTLAPVVGPSEISFAVGGRF